MNFGDSRLPGHFWAKCIPEPNSGCWLWLASTIGGYGQFGRSGVGVSALAHRRAYGVMAGSVPAELDHKCRTPLCCNPLHLEGVSHAENVRRGLVGQRAATRVACPRGHVYAEVGVVTGRRWRDCAECNRQRAKVST